MVICLQRGADLHMAQLMPLSLTVSVLDKGPLNACVQLNIIKELQLPQLDFSFQGPPQRIQTIASF